MTKAVKPTVEKLLHGTVRVMTDGTVEVEPDEANLGDLEQLELIDSPGVKWWLYRRSPDGSAAKGIAGEPAYLEKGAGPLDLDTVNEKHGPGPYLLRTQNPDGTYRGTRKFSIAGSPRTSTTTAAAPLDTDFDPTKLLAEQIRDKKGRLLLKYLEDQLATPAQTSAPAAGLGLAEVFKLLADERRTMVELLRGMTPPSASPEGILNFARDLAGDMSHAKGTTSWPDALLKIVPETLEFLGQRIPPGAFGRSVAAAPARVAGDAGAAPTAAATPPAIDGTALLIEALVRGQAKGTEPAALADAVEEFMNDAELADLARLSPEQLLAIILTRDARFEAPELRTYVVAFVTAIQSPPTDGDTPSMN